MPKPSLLHVLPAIVILVILGLFTLSHESGAGFDKAKPKPMATTTSIPTTIPYTSTTTTTAPTYKVVDYCTTVKTLPAIPTKASSAQLDSIHATRAPILQDLINNAPQAQSSFWKAMLAANDDYKDPNSEAAKQREARLESLYPATYRAVKTGCSFDISTIM